MSSRSERTARLAPLLYYSSPRWWVRAAPLAQRLGTPRGARPASRAATRRELRVSRRRRQFAESRSSRHYGPARRTGRPLGTAPSRSFYVPRYRLHWRRPRHLARASATSSSALTATCVRWTPSPFRFARRARPDLALSTGTLRRRRAGFWIYASTCRRQTRAAHVRPESLSDARLRIARSPRSACDCRRHLETKV